MRIRTFLLCACLCLSSTGAAEGGFTYISQKRSVSAENNKGSSATSVATSFDPFVASVRVEWNSPIPDYWGDSLYGVTAEQNSNLTTSIRARGYAYDQAPFDHYDDYFYQASSSLIEVVFELDMPHFVDLTGWLYADADTGGSNMAFYDAWVSLANTSEELFAVRLYPFCPSWGDPWPCMADEELDEHILLDRGRYTLSVGVAGNAVYGYYEDYAGYVYPGCGGCGGGSYDIVLTATPIPAPGAILLGTMARRSGRLAAETPDALTESR